MKFGIGNLHQELSSTFHFGLYLSIISSTLYEAHIFQKRSSYVA